MNREPCLIKVEVLTNFSIMRGPSILERRDEKTFVKAQTLGGIVFYLGEGIFLYKFFYSFSVIIFGLSLGYAIQVLVNRDMIKLPISMDRIRKSLQYTALLFVNPVAIVGAIWIVNIQSLRIVALPFLGLFALIMGGMLALGAAKLLHLEPKKTGTMYGCGAFTNIGSIGALICFVFLGEPGFALVPIYKLFEEVSYYGIGFPIAKYYSNSAGTLEGKWNRLKGLARDPFILVALSSIIFGGLLNCSNLKRPEFYATLNAVFVPLGTIMLLTSIGMALKFKRVRLYIKECVAVSLIKFGIVPILASTLALLIGFGNIDGGLPLKVVIILSSMPVAFTALIPPSIYDLDLDLANSCWFVTTALLIVVLPVLLLIIT